MSVGYPPVGSVAPTQRLKYSDDQRGAFDRAPKGMFGRVTPDRRVSFNSRCTRGPKEMPRISGYFFANR